MKRINNMCLNCSHLHADCNGAKTHFNGCINRDKDLIYINSNRCKNPLFTYDLYDDLTLDTKTGREYFTVIITQFSDTSENAHEIAHKRFYFTSDDIKPIAGYTGRGYSVAINNYLWDYGKFGNLETIFKNRENSKFFIERHTSEFYTVNGKTYKYI